MCYCCPPAISALFCLYVQSGCSQGSVAAALTFFPPDPALYKFERYDKSGKLLPDEETDNDQGNDEEEDDDGEDVELVEVVGSTGRVEPLEGRDKKKKNKKSTKSPAQQLTERVKQLRSRAKSRGVRDAEDARNGVSYNLVIDPRLIRPPIRGGTVEALKIPSKRNVHLATVIYRVPTQNVTPHTKTIIYSHGNATDVGAMFNLQTMMVQSLNCNVVMYDYSGFGESGGVPSEASTYTDIRAVYDYVLDHVTDNPKNVILYGQSVGSGPSCHLAHKNDDLGGMILHSPFTSGMRVLTPSRLLACLDIYPNINRIQHVRCPVMIIHGRLDEEVPFSHGEELHQKVPEHLRREPWWLRDRGHNDVTEGPGKMAEYIRRLRQFLNGLDE